MENANRKFCVIRRHTTTSESMVNRIGAPGNKTDRQTRGKKLGALSAAAVLCVCGIKAVGQ